MLFANKQIIKLNKTYIYYKYGASYNVIVGITLMMQNIKPASLAREAGFMTGLCHQGIAKQPEYYPNKSGLQFHG